MNNSKVRNKIYWRFQSFQKICPYMLLNNVCFDIISLLVFLLSNIWHNNSKINSLSFFNLYLLNLLFAQKKWLPMESALHLWAHRCRRNIKVTMRLHCASKVSQNLFTKEVTMNSIIKSLLFGEALQLFSPNILE